MVSLRDLRFLLSVHLISMYYVRKGSWAFSFIFTHKSMRSDGY